MDIVDKGMIHILGRAEQDGTNFIMLCKMAWIVYWKLSGIVYFWNFPLNISWLTVSTWKSVKQNCRGGDTTVALNKNVIDTHYLHYFYYQLWLWEYITISTWEKDHIVACYCTPLPIVHPERPQNGQQWKYLHLRNWHTLQHQDLISCCVDYLVLRKWGGNVRSD